MPELIHALHEAEKIPGVTVVQITGNGRFFSSGADVKGEAGRTPPGPPPQGLDMRMIQLARGSVALEMIRALIDCTKLLCIALNGPAGAS